MHDDMDRTTPEAALTAARVVWGVLLVGQAVFFLRVFLADLPQPRVGEEGRRLVGYLAVAGVGLLLPLGYHLRAQAYKRHWRGDAIAPRGYLMGNLLLFVACLSASALALLSALIRGAFWPSGLAGVTALLAYAINFPRGGAMRAAAEPPAPSGAGGEAP